MAATVDNKGIFGWESVDQCFLPYIIRTINGEQEKFVSARIVETQLLSKYKDYLNTDLYTCTSIRGHCITEAEAELINEINSKHSDDMFGKEEFVTGKEYVVRLFDVIELCTFIELCYNNLVCDFPFGRIWKCGFIRINSKDMLPYCMKDEQIYVPLFYFQCKPCNPRLCTEKLEGWDLAYLKLCCKILCISDELFASDSFIIVSLDDIKNCFLTETKFEEYWPTKEFNTYLYQKKLHVNPPNSWIRAPPPMVGKVMNTCAAAAPAPKVAADATPKTAAFKQQKQLAAVASTVSVSVAGMVPQQHRAMVMANSSTYQNSECPPNQMNSAVLLTNGQKHNVNHAPPLPLVRAPNTNKTTIVSNTTSHENSGKNARVTNTQQCSALRNKLVVAATPVSEVIDLSSSPSSPVPQAVQDTRLNQFFLIKIPERKETPERHKTSNNVSYKIQKANFRGKIIHCINAEPYVYSELMVALAELVQILFPSCSIHKCACILGNILMIRLYCGNSAQMTVLRKNGHLKNALYVDKTPLVMLQDINQQVMLQLKNLIAKYDETVPTPQEYHPSVPKKAKKQCMN